MLTVGILLQLHDQISGKLGGIKDRLGGLQKMGDSMIKYGTIASGVGLALRPISDRAQGFLGDVVRQSVALDEAAAMIQSMPGITEGAVDRIVAAGRKWSQSHTETGDQFVRTSYMMLSAGLDEVQALAATQTGLRVAKATMGDSLETANLLATSYNNFGDRARNAGQEIGRLGDMLTTTQQVFQFANMGQLAEGLKYATPAALAARMSFAETNAVIGQLNNAGLQGGQAGTAFAASLRQMTEASRDLGFQVAKNADGGLNFIGTLENIRAKYGDLTRLTDNQKIAFQKAFGDEGLRSIMLLSSKTDELRKNLDAVNRSAGAAAEAQAKMESGAGAQMQIALNNWNEFKLVFGEQILPLLKDLLPPFRSLLQAVAGFAKEHPNITATVAALVGIAAVVAPIASAAGGLLIFGGAALKFAPIVSAAIGIGMKFMAFNLLLPLFAKLAGGILHVQTALKVLATVARAHPVLLALTLIAAAAIAIYQNWDKVKAFFTGFFGWLEGKASKAAQWLKSLVPDWMANVFGGGQSTPATRQRLAPALPSASRVQSAQVGGEIRVKIDSEGRPKQVQATSRNPSVPVRADVGYSMAW